MNQVKGEPNIGFSIRECIHLLESALRDVALVTDDGSASGFACVTNNLRAVRERIEGAEVEVNRKLTEVGLTSIRSSGKITLHIAWSSKLRIYNVKLRGLHCTWPAINVQIDPPIDQTWSGEEIDTIAEAALLQVHATDRDAVEDCIAWIHLAGEVRPHVERVTG